MFFKLIISTRKILFENQTLFGIHEIYIDSRSSMRLIRNAIHAKLENIGNPPFLLGLSSQVFDENQKFIGHFPIFDFDNVDLKTFLELAERVRSQYKIDRIIGVKTDKGMHLYGMKIITWDQLQKMVNDPVLSKFEDINHKNISINRGQFVVRVGNQKFGQPNYLNIIYCDGAIGSESENEVELFVRRLIQ